MEKNSRHHGRPGKTGQNTFRRCGINYHHFCHGHSKLLHREIQSIPGHTNILHVFRYNNDTFVKLLLQFFVLIHNNDDNGSFFPGFAVCFIFVWHLTFFSACMAIAGYAEHNNRHSIICIKVKPVSMSGNNIKITKLIKLN